MRRWSVGLVAAAMLAGSSASVLGQSGEYTAPGEGGVDPGVESENLTKAVDESIWSLGRVRIDPWIGLNEVAWVKPAEQDGDLTVSAGAGVRAYVPIGARTTLSAQILPSYIWWNDREDDRRFGGTYGAGLFYFTDRTRVSLTATASDLDDYVTDEVDRRAEVDAVTYRLAVELPLGSRLGLFASAGRIDREVTDTFGGPGDLSDLDATTETLEGGLTWRVGSRVTLRAGAGTNETTFDESATDRSSEGEHWLAGLDWRRAKLSANVTVRQNDQQGTAGSSFGQFDGTTWQARVNWTPRPRFDLGLYGSRHLAYSVEAGQSFFLNERLGVRFGFPIGSRIAATAFYEVGEREYGGAGRIDDATSVGGDLSVPLGRRIRLRAGGRSTRTEGLEGSRTLTQYNFGLSFGSNRRGFF